MRKGEITAFLSIVFVLLLSFVMGILQVSSVQRSKSISRLAADRSVYSVFGEYHQGPLENIMYLQLMEATAREGMKRII